MSIVGTEIFIVQSLEEDAIGELAIVKEVEDVMGATIIFLGKEIPLAIDALREIVLGPDSTPITDLFPMIISDVPDPEWVTYKLTPAEAAGRVMAGWVPVYNIKFEIITGPAKGKILGSLNTFWVLAANLDRPFEEARVMIKEQHRLIGLREDDQGNSHIEA